jgi:PEP-CTERM motif
VKKILLLAVLVLALPTAVFAEGSIDYTNSGGILSGSIAGLTLSGSVLIAVNGLNGGGLLTGSNLGSVSFTTGALLSGSLKMGGTFAGGGLFTITGNGTNGVPDGTLFAGSFSGPVTWTMVTLANGSHNYSLTGTISGWNGSGAPTQGATVELTINTGKGFFGGRTRISSGDTSGSVMVPEPGSLTLLGSGLLFLAGLVRRKMNS